MRHRVSRSRSSRQPRRKGTAQPSARAAGRTSPLAPSTPRAVGAATAALRQPFPNTPRRLLRPRRGGPSGDAPRGPAKGGPCEAAQPAREPTAAAHPEKTAPRAPAAHLHQLAAARCEADLELLLPADHGGAAGPAQPGACSCCCSSGRCGRADVPCAAQQGEPSLDSGGDRTLSPPSAQWLRSAKGVGPWQGFKAAEPTEGAAEPQRRGRSYSLREPKRGIAPAETM